MTNVRRFTVTATAALLLIAGTACADSSSDPPATEPSVSSSQSPTPPAPPSGSTDPVSDSDAAASAATRVVRDYFTVVDTLRQQPGMSLTALRKVATSGELSAQQLLLRSERRKGLHQVGDTRIDELSVQSVNLDNSDPKSGKVPTAQVDVCWNVTEVDIIDKSGESVVSPSRPDSGWIRFTVANYHWAENPSGGWRVASSQDIKEEPCGAP